MTVDNLVEAARTFRSRISHRRSEFARLAAGQRPAVLFISCSDSRVVPSMITDAAPGQLFELRTAGAIIPPYSTESPCGVSATIEFALTELAIRDIVVCGHSHCGAVKALASPMDAPGPAVGRWLQQDHLAGTNVVGEDCSLRCAVEAHVVNQLTTLRSHPWVASLTSSGDLSTQAWYYEVDTGAVHRHDREQNAFRPI